MDERTGSRFTVDVDPRQTSERVQVLYDSFPLPAFTWSRDGDDFVLIDFNEAAAAWTGGAASRFMGIRATEVMGERQDILDDLNLCFRSRSKITREMSYENLAIEGGPWELTVTYVFVPSDLVVVYLDRASKGF